MPTKSIICKRLKEARLAAGLSQKQLGIAAGIDEFVASARMNQYETGKHAPDFSVIQKIAKALKVPTAFFYALDDILAEMIKNYGRLSVKNQRQVLSIIKKIMKENI